MNAAVQKSGCPADEGLALYIEGRLDEASRDAVVEHLVECGACRHIVHAADELSAVEHDAVATARTGRRSSLVRVAGLLAAAAVVAYALYLGPLGDRLLAPRRARALAEATSSLPTRPIAARPSVEIDYGPHEVYRAQRRESLGDAGLLEAAAKIERATERHRTVTNLHQLGVAHLMLTDLDPAIDLLEEALKKTTARTDLAQAIAACTDADLLNDLAAAYNERRSVSARDQQRAASAVTRAWELKKSPAIAWTRATVLASKESWTDYLALDGTSEWAAEARENLAGSDR